MTVQENASLLPYNTFGIPARCQKLVEYSSIDELQQYLSTHPAASPLLHVGRGSNLLFVEDYNGTVLHSAIGGITVEETSVDAVLLRAGAGIVWDDLVAYTVQHGYYGLENLSLIPGEVGAAAVQNIGAYGVEVADYIDSIETVDLRDGTTRTFQKEDCHYAYRYSIFKSDLRGRYAITAVTFHLSRTFTPRLAYGALRDSFAAVCQEPSAARLRTHIIDIRRHKLPDPSVLGNAGSFFINPTVSAETFAHLRTLYPDMPNYPATNGIKIPAAWLIQQCGWKGRRCGAVGVYEKQALVLVNYGGATGRDIVALSDNIRADVMEKFGVAIHPEVNFIGS